MPSLAQDSKSAPKHSFWRRRTSTQSDHRERSLQRFELLAVVALATLYLFWFAWPSLWSASQNVRLVEAFSADEATHVMLLKQAIESRTLQLGYIQYGYTYLNMALLPLLLLSLFTTVIDQQIIVWLRMIPTLFASGTVVLTFMLARRFFGRLAAWLSALLLSFTVLAFLRMSVMSHSDIPQLFFLMLGLYSCCRSAAESRLRWLGWASLAAGLAFGCKYSGLFLLPIIACIGALVIMQMGSAPEIASVERLVRGYRLLAAAVGVALLVAPLVVVPYGSTTYGSEEYFGISVPELLATLRLISILLGAACLLLAAVPPVWAVVRRRPKMVLLMQQGMLWAFAFSGAFVVSSPFHVFSLRAGFLRGFLYESLHSSFGHGFAAQRDGLSWLRLLSSEELLDPFILGLAIVGLALTLGKVAARGRQVFLLPESVLGAWSLFYLVFLLWRVHVRTYRALLPIIPPLVMLAAHATSHVLRAAQSRTGRRLAPLVAVAGLLLVIALALPDALGRALDFRRRAGQREQGSAALLAGQWLEANYPHEARVLYDPYSYVPPAFADAHATPWGGTAELLETLQPDVVIVNDLSSERFSDVRMAPAYARDEELFIAKHVYYQALRDGTAGYKLIRDFGSVRVYAKQSGTRLLLHSTGLRRPFTGERTSALRGCSDEPGLVTHPSASPCAVIPA